jgi:hypothetical protein
MSIPDHYRPLKSNSYTDTVREELKERGGRFDRETGLWWVPPEKLKEAEELLEVARWR